MPVGKAKAATADTASEDFSLVVPCLTSVDEASIRAHLERDEFFWLDLTAPGLDDLAKLRELFGFHPLALEDTEHFGERPKLDNYVDYILDCQRSYGPGGRASSSSCPNRQTY